jgi:hypothetical protein
VLVQSHDPRFGITHSSRRLELRFVVAAVVLAVVLFASLRAYFEYETHRAKSLLAEASRVQIGAAEASVLPMVKRYDGYKWKPEPLPPKDQWIEKDEYDYQRNLLSDYKYELEISPFGTTARDMSRWTRAMLAVRNAVPSRLRSVLGMREWGTGVQLSIRNNRVQSVSATTLVEGRSKWLGHRWEVAEGMPRHDMRPRAYTIGSGILEMGDNGGTMIENYFTPSASEEEVQAALSFNARCLTSVAGCNGLCDFTPSALQYLEQHPDVALNIIPPKCQ